MMVDKKESISSLIFLFKFKMGHKQQRQLTTSPTHLAQELLMNIQCSSCSRSCAKEMSLEDECSG